MTLSASELTAEIEAWSDRLSGIITSTDPVSTFGAMQPVELLGLLGNIGALLRFAHMVGAAAADRLTAIAVEAMGA